MSIHFACDECGMTIQRMVEGRSTTVEVRGLDVSFAEFCSWNCVEDFVSDKAVAERAALESK